MEIIKVVCGIIWKDDKVFIARRKPEKALGGYWEFPGGKLEENESPENALRRELTEELGMKAEIGNFFGTNIHNYETFTIELHAYNCTFIFSTFSLTDHDELEFVSPADLFNFHISPADMKFVNMLNDSRSNNYI
jgi:8-oxo-dGTP diphosphatase